MLILPVDRGSMVCSVFILLGAIISAAGSNQDTFGLVMGGRVVMGFGSTVIETVTSKVYRHGKTYQFIKG